MEIENGQYYQIQWRDEESLIGLKIPTKGNDILFPSFVKEDGHTISVPIERVIGPIVVGSCELPIAEVVKQPMYITAEHEAILLKQSIDIDKVAREAGFNGYAIYDDKGYSNGN